MATKLSDSEFAERARAGNRQRADRRRGRLAMAGYQQLLVWLPVDLRCEIDRVASERTTTLTEATALIVRAGLAALTTTTQPATPEPIASPPPLPESIPLFQPVSTETEKQPPPSVDAPPLTCINADLNSLIEGGSVKAEPAKAAPGTTAERDAAIVQLHKEGLSLAAIGQRLLDRGIATTNGTALSKTTIARTLKNAGLRANGVAPGR